MADDRREALRDYGWIDEGDDQWVSAAHVNMVIILGGAGGGWQVRTVEDDVAVLAGHSRYGTKLGDWLHRLEEPQAAGEA